MIRTNMAVALATAVALVSPAHGVAARSEVVWAPTMPAIADYLEAFPDGIAYALHDGFNNETPVLWRSADKGFTWEKRELPAHQPGAITKYVVEMATPAIGYALKLSELAPPEEYVEYPAPEVYRTDDGARTWRRLAVPFPALPGLKSGSILLRASTDGRGVFMGMKLSYQGEVCRALVDGGSTYFMSTDGGESWSMRAFPAPGWITDAYFASARDAVVSVREARLYTAYYEGKCSEETDGFGNSLWTTHNSGRGFTRAHACLNEQCLGPVAMTASGRIVMSGRLPLSDSPVLASHGASVLASDDGGKTWRVVLKVPSSSSVADIDFAQGGRVGYLRSQHLWRTEDDGTTWQVDSDVVGGFAAGDDNYAIGSSLGFLWTRRAIP